MADPQDEWLVAIDMQTVFAAPDSPWFTPTFKAVGEQIASLLPLFGKRVIFTRFIPPETRRRKLGRLLPQMDVRDRSRRPRNLGLGCTLAGPAGVGHAPFLKMGR